MPSTANDMERFFKQPYNRQELLLNFYDVLYSQRPIVDNPQFETFMKMSPEERTVLYILTEQFGALFQTKYFNEYLSKTPDARVKFKNTFLEMHTSLTFSPDTRSQLADIFDRRITRPDYMKMQESNLIGQPTVHPSKNRKLQDTISKDRIDYKEPEEQYTKELEVEDVTLEHFIRNSTSNVHPLPLKSIKSCRSNESYYQKIHMIQNYI